MHYSPPVYRKRKKNNMFSWQQMQLSLPTPISGPNPASAWMQRYTFMADVPREILSSLGLQDTMVPRQLGSYYPSRFFV